MFVREPTFKIEERHYRKLVPVSDYEREELDEIRRQIWGLYEALKASSNDPSDEKSSQLTSIPLVVPWKKRAL